MITTIIKNTYRKFLPFVIREKIWRIRHCKEVNFSKKCFERQELHFKSHIDDFMFDTSRKTDILRIFSLLKKNGNFPFPEMNTSIREKYATRKLKIEKDTNTGLFYVLVDGKKLFYKKGMDVNSISNAFNTVSLEQDYASPHRYLTNDHYFVGVMPSGSTQFIGDSFGVSGGVVVDVGAAEGNFALSVVEKVRKLYIVEGDAEWCEALKKTFLPYKDKVVIIQKYLSNVNDGDNIALTGLVEKYHIDKIDFLKMDIEGCEKQALCGGIMNNMKFMNIIKMVICVYHNPEDEVEISNFVSRYGYKYYLTSGYMYFPDSTDPPIRKAILRAYKMDELSKIINVKDNLTLESV